MRKHERTNFFLCLYRLLMSKVSFLTYHSYYIFVEICASKKTDFSICPTLLTIIMYISYSVSLHCVRKLIKIQTCILHIQILFIVVAAEVFKRWQFLTHKNSLSIEICSRKTSHAWFTYLNFFQDKNIQRRKHLKLIVQLKWKCLQNLSLTGFTQNKSLCSLEIWDRNEQNNYLKKVLGYTVCPITM